ncbi:pilus assembly PilX N-terminal domain-containing protein [Marinobacter xestospongiae]|uniref:pilus assembly PilX N-terminal domain-containing protein n=1 Tax=Marinobacter xestospongiae TaxID=994319 RepID=UPI002004462B|nr:pilus assembly PilX N-terminal domain-containing protein [Marinobacter xestospongiae]MCK7568853.1 pilus assembly PilX N-terminal domain-containing protein [Marinobacter xestospongiae]
MNVTNFRKTQQGAALLISLIVLLVISVIGIAGMNSSILQERMSANAQSARQAFFAAEAASQDLFKRLETMNSNSAEWKRALNAQDTGIMRQMPLQTYTGLSLSGQVNTEIRYLGEARIIDGYSLGEDIETYRHRFMLIGSSNLTGSGATATITRGVSAVFY